MTSLKHLEHKNSQTAFDKKVLSAIQHLHPYVKHRLYIAESIGILPKNMYSSNGIIDDGIAKLYERGYNVDADPMYVKLELFKIIDKELDSLFREEAFHKTTVSTSSILKDELESLEEVYTVDEDFDFIMHEELSDISYRQNEHQPHLFLYDDQDSTVLNALEIEDMSGRNRKRLLGRMYSLLPFKTSDIIDLFVFGKLSFEDIAKVKQIELERVKSIFRMVNKNFRKNLG